MFGTRQRASLRVPKKKTLGKLLGTQLRLVFQLSRDLYITRYCMQGVATLLCLIYYRCYFEFSPTIGLLLCRYLLLSLESLTSLCSGLFSVNVSYMPAAF
jgi:hypothetical protein